MNKIFIFDSSETLPRFARVALAGSGFLVAGLLFVAWTSTPSPQGYGTHRELLGFKLPPCGFRQMFGYSCPSCGMTTSWSYLTKGRVVESINANPGGTLLGIVSALFAPWAIFSGIQGRWFLGYPDYWTTVVTMVVIAAVTLVQWLVRLYF